MPHGIGRELRRDDEVDRPAVRLLEVEQPPEERLRQHALAGIPLERHGDEVDLVLTGPQLADEVVREDLGAASLEGHLRGADGYPHRYQSCSERLVCASSESTRRERSSTSRSSASLTIRCSESAGSTYQRISFRSTRLIWNASHPFGPGRRSSGLSALTGQNRSASPRTAAGSRLSRSRASRSRS